MEAQRGVDQLRQHVTGTYLNVRFGIVMIGAALPVALWLGGRIFDDESLRASMSAYYYSLTMRNVFVGALAAIGAILYLYKGFSRAEDWALNLAGICVILVALVPTDAPGAPPRDFTWHAAFAVSFFVCIAYVCIFRASDTLSLIRDASRARALHRVYHGLGAAMIIAPILAVLLSRWLSHGAHQSVTVFFVEAAGVWVFASYWLIKSLELGSTNAAQLALQGKLQFSTTMSGARRVVQVEPDD